MEKTDLHNLPFIILWFAKMLYFSRFFAVTHFISPQTYSHYPHYPHSKSGLFTEDTLENFRFSFKIIYAILGAVNKSELLLPRKAHLGSGYSMITLKKPASAGITAVTLDRVFSICRMLTVNLSKFILSSAQSAGYRELTISSIADIFDHTENDVRRALVYWEKQGLLILSRDSSGEIREIAFHRSLGRPRQRFSGNPGFCRNRGPLTQSPPAKRMTVMLLPTPPRRLPEKFPNGSPLPRIGSMSFASRRISNSFCLSRPSTSAGL